MRDSNPRAFWANGFQDRLVVTASIILRNFRTIEITYLDSTDEHRQPLKPLYYILTLRKNQLF